MKRDWLITTLTSVTVALGLWTVTGVSDLKSRMAVVEYRLAVLTPPIHTLIPRPSPYYGNAAFPVPSLLKKEKPSANETPVAQ